MEPLAYRIRPKKLDEFFGQEHIVGEGKLLRRLIKADKLTSAIFWGPPGCGKTSLARIISNVTKYNFVELNAGFAGVADIKKVAEESENVFINPLGKVILFIDEIHRFNKLQQDTLLPFVEKGSIVLIGATTENPYFEVNKALISRSVVFKLEPLDENSIKNILEFCINDKENGLGNYNLKIDDEVLKILAQNSNGDVRTALNSLELAVLSTDMNSDGKIVIDKSVILDSLQKKVVYDKTSESHYDIISAFIKSMRGGSQDAVLHYLARMLEGGEDPKFIARRIVICASEDVGLANNQALVVANAALQSIMQIGMPEARIILAHAALVVTNSKKSNTSYLGINMAIEDVKNIDIGVVPMHLRNAPVKSMQDYGYSQGYKYPHDYDNGHVDQQYMPDKLINKKYYIPKGWEKL